MPGGIAIGAGIAVTRRLIVGVTVGLHLLLLCAFKYLDFLVGSANHLMHVFGTDRELPFMEIILPVGISFYTFQSISLHDRRLPRRCRAVPAPRRLSAVLSFFPQLVAGPIVRARDLPAAARAAAGARACRSPRRRAADPAAACSRRS